MDWNEWRTFASADTMVDEAFVTYGVTEPTAQTRAALETWLTAQKAKVGQPYIARQYLTKLVFLSPEFQMA